MKTVCIRLGCSVSIRLFPNGSVLVWISLAWWFVYGTDQLHGNMKNVENEVHCFVVQSVLSHEVLGMLLLLGSFCLQALLRHLHSLWKGYLQAPFPVLFSCWQKWEGGGRSIKWKFFKVNPIKLNPSPTMHPAYP